MKYAVVLGQIGDDNQFFTFKTDATSEEGAILNALSMLYYEQYSDVYDDVEAMKHDGYSIYDVIPETFFND